MQHSRTLPLVVLVLAVACSQDSLPSRPLAPGLSAARGPVPSASFVAGPSQPLLDPSGTEFAIDPLDPDSTVFASRGKQNLAQTFTPPTNMTLYYLSLPVACLSGVNLHLQLRAGAPNGSLLYDHIYDLGHTFNDGTFQDLHIPGGLSLTGGSAYAFVLSAAPTAVALHPNCDVKRGPVGADSYAGGGGFYNNPGYSPYWIPIVTSYPGPQEDLPFRTLVR